MRCEPREVVAVLSARESRKPPPIRAHLARAIEGRKCVRKRRVSGSRNCLLREAAIASEFGRW